jgi:hypothetical protein
MKLTYARALHAWMNDRGPVRLIVARRDFKAKSRVAHELHANYKRQFKHFAMLTFGFTSRQFRYWRKDRSYVSHPMMMAKPSEDV